MYVNIFHGVVVEWIDDKNECSTHGSHHSNLIKVIGVVHI